MTLSTEYTEAEMQGLPEMYDFVYAGNHERYTTWPEDIVFLGTTFQTAPIKRSGFTFDKEFSSVRCTISAPVTAGFERFVTNTPLEPTTLTIYRALKSDLTDYSILFVGLILTVGFSNRIAQAICESNSGILNHETPRIVYQSYCNHEIFDAGCGLDYTAYIVNAVVTVSGSTLSSATFDTYDDGYFNIGRVQYGADERLITDHTGTDLEIHMPFDSTLVDGSSVVVYPGCDGKPDTCRVFNNFEDHFLGFPYIPSKNPVYWGV